MGRREGYPLYVVASEIQRKTVLLRQASNQDIKTNLTKISGSRMPGKPRLLMPNLQLGAYRSTELIQELRYRS